MQHPSASRLNLADEDGGCHVMETDYAAFLKAVDYSAIVSVTDAHGIITYVNDHFVRVSGYQREELIGQYHNIVRHPEMSDRVFEHLWQTIQAKKPWRGLIKNQRKDGGVYYVKSVILPVTDEVGDITQFISIRNDVTDIIEAKQTLREQFTDPLTELPNRMALLKTAARQQQDKVAVFDLRNFKLFNDYWGIDIGDVYIRKLAGLFEEIQPEFAVTVYRLDGACFGVMPTQSQTLAEFCLTAERIKSRLEHHNLLFDDIDCDIQLSVGVGVSATRALAYAESALADAKTKFYGRSVVIKDDQNTRDDTFYWVEQIKTALREDRVLACFQKIVTHPRTAALQPTKKTHDKYEALVRLRLPNGRVVSPALYLDHLKKTRYYAELTKTMLSKALSFSQQRNCKVAVNLCIHDMLDDDTVAFIETLLHERGGQRIIFEITESEAVNDFDKVSDFICRVRELGASIAIDDFGSGYSNFVYLVQLKPEYIKIDGSIISSIVDNEQSYLVTQSIVDMARNLKVKTIAEFVSSDAILARLQSLDIDFLQGFYLHKPELT